MRISILAEFPTGSLDVGALGRGAGQACTWLPQLAMAFERHPSLDVHWMVLDRNARRYRTREAFGQTFHLIPAVPFSADLALNYLPARFVLRRIIKRLQPRLVHAWGAELIYPAALQDFNGPRIFSLQGALNYYWNVGGLPNDWRWRKMVSSEKGFIRSATVVTAESPWARERVLDLAPEVDCRIVDYGVHRSFFETRWRPDPEHPYALYVGGGGHRKGIDILCEALHEIGARDWRMRFAGDDGLRRQIEASGAPACDYLGMLSWNDLIEALAGAWCLVVPTRADTGPTVVKEARVVGVPVVGTLHGGLRDYIRHGHNGWIVDPLEPSRLADGLCEVMSSYDKVLRMGHSFREEDRARFSPERTADGFLEIYSELTQ